MKYGSLLRSIVCGPIGANVRGGPAPLATRTLTPRRRLSSRLPFERHFFVRCARPTTTTETICSSSSSSSSSSSLSLERFPIERTTRIREEICAPLSRRETREDEHSAHTTPLTTMHHASNQTDVIIVAPKRLYIYIYVCVCVCVCVYIYRSLLDHKKVLACPPNKRKGAKKRSKLSFSLSLNETLNINPTLFFFVLLFSRPSFFFFKKKRYKTMMMMIPTLLTPTLTTRRR